MKRIALVIVAILAMMGIADAQQKTPVPAPRPKLTAVQAQANPLAVLDNILTADLQAALADAQAHNDPITTPCWQALLDAKLARQAPALELPKGIFSAVQKARDLELDLQNAQAPNSALNKINDGCARLVLHGQNVLLMLGVSGGMIAGTGGLTLPALPGMLPLLLLPK